jgi:cellobiose-specific phosphotransferase system component IIA
VKNADSLAREHTEKAIDTIAEIMDDTFAENKDRLAAAKEILNRGHGMPSQAIIAVPGNRALAAQLAQMSDDELMKVLTETRLPRLAPIEATFTEVPDPLLE